MSLYALQKVIYELNRNPNAVAAFKTDIDAFLKDYQLTEEELRGLKKPDIGLLYVLGVNGQLLMHYAALLGVEWFDYLQAMRDGVSKYGPVRAGIYAMTGEGKRFTQEDSK